jgi:F0F1-type ATP synthase assembly protein I
VELGIYKKLYDTILVSNKKRTELGVLTPRAIELYFDYKSENGYLKALIRKNSDKSTEELLLLLLENSKEYGLSDTQANALIKSVLEKSELQYMPIGMCIGLSIGMSLGSFSGNIALGMCIGLSLGVCVGAIIDHKIKER